MARRARLSHAVDRHGLPGERAPDGVFPWELTDGVHLCGYNSEHSFGAHSYLVVRPEGNLLVDSPRFTRRLWEPIDALGDIDHVLLRTRGDVVDADRWADRYGARVWIHELEHSAAPYATELTVGTEPQEIRPGLVVVPVPGHTRGSVITTWRVGTSSPGDTLHWDHRATDSTSSRSNLGPPWEALTTSVKVMADLEVGWVLPGHGKWHGLDPGDYRRQMVELAASMPRRRHR